MTSRKANIGGHFIAVERGLWPKFCGWPFCRELREIEAMHPDYCPARQQPNSLIQLERACVKN